MAMAPTAIVDVKTQDSRQSILDAAEHIIAQHGYSGLSMRALSRESGLAKSTLYHYFQDKHDIHVNVIERDVLLFEQVLAEAAQRGKNSRERLQSLIQTYLEHNHEHGSIALHILRRTGEFDKPILEMFSRHRASLLAPFVSVISAGIEEGIFQPVEVEMSVITLLGMMNSFAAHRLLFECGPTDFYAKTDKIVENTLSVFLYGISSRSDYPLTQESTTPVAETLADTQPRSGVIISDE